MEESRRDRIQNLAGDGDVQELRKLLEPDHTQLEIDEAFEIAIAYSQLETAEYLLSHGADFGTWNYNGVYYAVHNGELEALQYSISKGVDINVRNGMILNTSIMTAINTQSMEMVQWILDNGADVHLLTKESRDLVKRYGGRQMNDVINKAKQKGL